MEPTRNRLDISDPLVEPRPQVPLVKGSPPSPEGRSPRKHEPAALSLNDCEQFLKTLMQVIPVGVHVKRLHTEESPDDAANDLLLWNAAAEAMFAIDPVQSSGGIPHFSLPREVASVQAAQEALLRKTRRPSPESAVALHRCDGQPQTLRMTSYPVLGACGEVAFALTITENVSALSEAKRDISMVSRTDALTGLANRAGFFDNLQAALARARRAKTGIAVLFLDIDHFGTLNQTIGSDKGDLVLQQFGARLKQVVRCTDSVARLAGDEFAVIVEAVRSMDEGELVTHKILAALGHPWIIDGGAMVITASAGMVYDHTHAHSAADLIGYGDELLYAAKTSGGNTVRMTACCAACGDTQSASRSTDA